MQGSAGVVHHLKPEDERMNATTRIAPLPAGVSAVVLEALGTRVHVVNGALSRAGRRLARHAAAATATNNHDLQIVRTGAPTKAAGSL